MKNFLQAFYMILRRSLELIFALPPQAACRFTPTCSVYCQEAITTHGLKGLFFCVRRLFRCHPWGSSGHDPVPKRPLST